MGAKLLQDVRQDLADVVQVCEGRKKQTNYLRTLINELVKGVWPCAPGAQHRARPHVSAVHASFCLRAAWCPCLGGRLRKTQEPIFSYMPICVIVTFLGGLKSQGAGSPQAPELQWGQHHMLGSGAGVAFGSRHPEERQQLGGEGGAALAPLHETAGGDTGLWSRVCRDLASELVTLHSTRRHDRHPVGVRLQ